jgi:hypothetical protein
MQMVKDQIEQVPDEVQKAWDVVAAYLNTRPEFVFHIDNWSERHTEENDYSPKKSYTLNSTERTLKIVANNTWEGLEKK